MCRPRLLAQRCRSGAHLCGKNFWHRGAEVEYYNCVFFVVAETGEPVYKAKHTRESKKGFYFKASEGLTSIF